MKYLIVSSECMCAADMCTSAALCKDLKRNEVSRRSVSSVHKDTKRECERERERERQTNKHVNNET